MRAEGQLPTRTSFTQACFSREARREKRARSSKFLLPLVRLKGAQKNTTRAKIREERSRGDGKRGKLKAARGGGDENRQSDATAKRCYEVRGEGWLVRPFRKQSRTLYKCGWIERGKDTRRPDAAARNFGQLPLSVHRVTVPSCSTFSSSMGYKYLVCISP